MKNEFDPQAAARKAVWRLDPERATAWRIWDGEAVVYDDLSGDTLRLDVVMTEIFKRLHQGPASLAQLTAQLASVLDLEQDLRLEHVTRTALDRLAECGLTVPPPSPPGAPPAGATPA